MLRYVDRHNHYVLVREMKAFTQGFSMIELMVTLVVLSVIIVLAAPSFGEMLDSSRMAAAAGELTSDFSLARTEAARRGKRVTLCVSSDGATCSSSATNWNVGWIVFADVVADGVLTASEGDELLRRRDAISSSGGLSFVSSGLTSSGRVQFRPSGAADSEGTFLLCKSGKPGANGRLITLKYSGAVTRATGATCT